MFSHKYNAGFSVLKFSETSHASLQTLLLADQNNIEAVTMINWPSIRLVTLDLTGTVFMFRKAPFVQYGETASIYGYEMDQKTLRKAFSHAWKDQNKNDPHFGAVSGSGSEKWWKKLVHETMKGDDSHEIKKMKCVS